MTTLTRNEILSRLKDLAGPGGYLEDRVDVEPFEVDFRKLYKGATPLVLRPDSTDRHGRGARRWQYGVLRRSDTG
jgi:hypothetical protein